MPVQHMVMVQFKPDTPQTEIDAIFEKIMSMKSLIPGIEYIGGGPYSSPEGLNGPYTHGFLLTFSDAAARDAYLPHPEHEKVKNAILPHVDAVCAFDFQD